MARQNLPWQNKDKDADAVKTESLFGSHEDMVVSGPAKPLVAVGYLQEDEYAPTWLVLLDERGYYATTADRLWRDPHPQLADTRRSTATERRETQLDDILAYNGFTACPIIESSEGTDDEPPTAGWNPDEHDPLENYLKHLEMIPEEEEEEEEDTN